MTQEWDLPVDVSHLAEDQQTAVKKMLREESGAFSQDESDLVCILRLKMTITLRDTTPIQRFKSPVESNCGLQNVSPERVDPKGP